MHKRFIFPLLIVAPLITSCKGGIVSPTFARGVVDNIYSIINNEKYDYKKFTYKFSYTYGEETKFIKVVFDNVNQFYTKYVIEHTLNEEGNYIYKTSEYWSYVRENNGTKYYYDLVRFDGAHSETDVNTAIVTYVEGDGPVVYEDEQWIKKSKEVIGELHESYLLYSLRNVDSLINYKDIVNKANITLSSANDESICAEGKVDLVTFDYQIDNAKLTSYSFQIDDTHKKWFSCNYNRAQITYLNI